MVWVTWMLPSALPAKVYSLAAPENTAVSMSAIGIARRHDLAHDLELAGIDRAGKHGGGERRHAVVRARSGPRGSFGSADADVDVQPLVAVDDVVAAAARDPVAAVATEDDVTRGVGGDTRTQDRLQARDESDALRP